MGAAPPAEPRRAHKSRAPAGRSQSAPKVAGGRGAAGAPARRRRIKLSADGRLKYERGAGRAPPRAPSGGRWEAPADRRRRPIGGRAAHDGRPFSGRPKSRRVVRRPQLPAGYSAARLPGSVTIGAAGTKRSHPRVAQPRAPGARQRAAALVCRRRGRRGCRSAADRPAGRQRPARAPPSAGDLKAARSPKVAHS